MMIRITLYIWLPPKPSGDQLKSLVINIFFMSYEERVAVIVPHPRYLRRHHNFSFFLMLIYKKFSVYKIYIILCFTSFLQNLVSILCKTARTEILSADWRFFSQRNTHSLICEAEDVTIEECGLALLDSDVRLGLAKVGSRWELVWKIRIDPQ